MKKKLQFRPEKINALVRRDGPCRSIQLDYGTMIDAVKDTEHLSPQQLSCIGGLIASRLSIRGERMDLAEMIERAARQLREAYQR